MLHKIIYRILAGLLTVLLAFFVGAFFGLGAFFPLKGVVIIAFIVGFFFPSILDGD